jgi:ABC-type transporter Mla maintaining outer membrane lipid asymmetry ATPase subunit MlaF
MSMRFAAGIEGGRLRLLADDNAVIDLSLNEGGRHRIIVEDAVQARQVVAVLEECDGIGVLTAAGSLPGAMPVAESMALVLRYHQDSVDSADDERQLESALYLCGLPAARIAGLGREQPMKLDRVERWRIGLARWLLRPPELLVIDRAFAGLTRREAETLIAAEASYHLRHPFRAALFVDLDSHELPELPDCRSLVHLAELACHS